MSLKSFFKSVKAAAAGGKLDARVDESAVVEDSVLETLMRAPEPVEPKVPAKILRDSLRLADNGSVQYRVSAPDGSVVQGVIEQTFFEEFMTSPTDKIDAPRKGRIIQQNFEYLEMQVDRLWREGNRDIVIK